MITTERVGLAECARRQQAALLRSVTRGPNTWKHHAFLLNLGDQGTVIALNGDYVDEHCYRLPRSEWVELMRQRG